MPVLTDRLPTLNLHVDAEPSGPLATRPFGLDAITNPVTVAPLGTGIVRAEKTGDNHAVGRFLSTPAYFMPLRTAGDSGIIRRPPLPAGDARSSELGADAVVDEGFRFLVGVALGPLGWDYDLSDDGRPTGARVWDAAGSIAELRPDGSVRESGSRSLWCELEAAHRLYETHGRPARDRYGITIAPAAQTVWLDRADGPAWSLPGG